MPRKPVAPKRKAPAKAGKKAEPKRTAGRPPAYEESFCVQAEKYCMLGATNAQLAELFGVSDTTIDNWLAKYSEFLGAVKRGRAEADSRVAESLFQRAVGYSHPEDKVFLHEGTPVVVPTVKHYPPDTTAAIFWLKNRRRADWKDYKAVEVSNAADEEGNAVPFLVDSTASPGWLNSPEGKRWLGTEPGKRWLAERGLSTEG